MLIRIFCKNSKFFFINSFVNCLHITLVLTKRCSSDAESAISSFIFFYNLNRINSFEINVLKNLENFSQIFFCKSDRGQVYDLLQDNMSLQSRSFANVNDAKNVWEKVFLDLFLQFSRFSH